MAAKNTIALIVPRMVGVSKAKFTVEFELPSGASKIDATSYIYSALMSGVRSSPDDPMFSLNRLTIRVKPENERKSS